MKRMTLEYETTTFDAVCHLVVEAETEAESDSDGFALSLMGGGAIVVRQTGAGREYRLGTPDIFPAGEGWAPLIRMRG